MKIRISYEKPQELQRVLETLRPITKSCKTEKTGKGLYKKAYVEIKPEEKET